MNLPMTKLTSLIATVGLVTAVIITLVAHHGDLTAAANAIAILIAIVTGSVGPVITTVAKVEKVQNHLENGLMVDKIKQAVRDGAFNDVINEIHGGPQLPSGGAQPPGATVTPNVSRPFVKHEEG